MKFVEHRKLIEVQISRRRPTSRFERVGEQVQKSATRRIILRRPQPRFCRRLLRDGFKLLCRDRLIHNCRKLVEPFLRRIVRSNLLENLPPLRRARPAAGKNRFE